MTRIMWAMGWFLAMAALAGCAAQQTSQFYTLSADAPASSPPAAGRDFSVAVGQATIPDSVDRPQIVVRVTPNRVELAEYHRWADSLKVEIPRTIAQNLATDLGVRRVWAYPANATIAADYEVSLDVQRFESALGDAATIELLWTVRRGRDGQPHAGHSLVREPAAGGYDSLAAAHSRALAGISTDIAKVIREMSADSH